MPKVAKFLLSFVIIFSVSLASWAIINNCSSNNEETEFNIVSTFYPITQLTEAVAGNHIQVTQLVPSGQEVHDFQAKPSTISELKQANLVIINGAGLEAEWLDPLIESAGRSDLPILDLSENLKLLTTSEESGEEDHAINTDPHIWLSPKNVMIMVETIKDKLMEVDRDNRLSYQDNALAYSRQLVQLDRDLTDAVANFAQKRFVAFHNAFSYFARDYRLEQVATIQATPGRTTTPQELDRIRQLVKTYNLKVIYSEPQFTADIVEQIAKDLSLEVVELDPLETNDRATSYIDGMKRNLENLKRYME